MNIDKRLTEINIFKLIGDMGFIPFEEISDEEIRECLEEKVFLTLNAIYNERYIKYESKPFDISKSRTSQGGEYEKKQNKMFDLLKISTIVNEIQNNTYNYNYPMVVWEDYDDGVITYDADCENMHQIRAFYYCKKNIYMSINHCQ